MSGSAERMARKRARDGELEVVRVRAERLSAEMVALFPARDRLMESGRADRAVGYVERVG